MEPVPQNEPQPEAQRERGEGWMLAYHPDLGSIFRCPSCRNIHLNLGDLRVQMLPFQFFAFVELVERSAANFELMLEVDGKGL